MPAIDVQRDTNNKQQVVDATQSGRDDESLQFHSCRRCLVVVCCCEKVDDKSGMKEVEEDEVRKWEV